MTNTQTIKTIHYFRALTMLAVLAMVVAMMLAPNPAHASTTFIVNSTSDLGDPNTKDGQCVIPDFSGVDHCTLRAAIQNANGTPGADTIKFAIPLGQSTTITPGTFGSTPLPAITEQVTIDGYTQQGAQKNTKAVGDDAVLKIELDGTNVSSDSGLTIVDSSNCVIRGLVINRFGTGVAIHGDSVGNRVEGNFIGTDPSGTLDLGNGLQGLFVGGDDFFGSPSKTLIGGPTPGKRNIISANHGSGVKIVHSNLSSIRGNYVGTDISGTKALGNDGGIVIGDNASGTTVGGTTVASRNVISGNDLSGIDLDDALGTNILGNRIGTAASGTTALGNHSLGVAVRGNSSDNKIGDGTPEGSNTIAFNSLDGVGLFASSAGTTVSRNSIFSNVGLGMDLIGPFERFDTNVSTPNDALDPDSGPNSLQNFPVITSAKTVSAKTTIKGKLNSTPAKTFTVQFFSNPSSGDEGRTFIGQKSVTTGSDGKVLFTFSPATKVAAGRTITATATGSEGTSEFSTPRTVISG
jgi:CSLREA domain-containing protein